MTGTFVGSNAPGGFLPSGVLRLLPPIPSEQVPALGTHYDEWGKAGYIRAAPGNVIDYDWIFEQIEQDADTYDIDQIAFDRWGAARVSQVLQNKGLTMVQFGQGFASMSPPMKELERLVLSKKIRHGGNPALTWMADNLIACADPAGNVKPDKEKSWHDSAAAPGEEVGL